MLSFIITGIPICCFTRSEWTLVARKFGKWLFVGDFDFCPQLIIATIDHPYHLKHCLPSLVLGCYISSAAHSYKNNYCLQANEINNVVVGYQLPGTQLRLVQNSRLFPDFFQNNSLFSRLKVTKYVVTKDLEKHRDRPFFKMHFKRQ